MALIKPPLLTFREKNPNLFQLKLMRNGQAIVPSDSLNLKIELRTDQTGRVLKALPLTQPDEAETILATLLPDLPAGTYYVDLLQEPIDAKEYRSGLCVFSILPIGSLDKISDALLLTATLDERSLILQANIDDTPSSALAAAFASQAEAAKNTVLDSLGSMVLFVEGNEQSVTLVWGESNTNFEPVTTPYGPGILLTY